MVRRLRRRRSGRPSLTSTSRQPIGPGGGRRCSQLSPSIVRSGISGASPDEVDDLIRLGPHPHIETLGVQEVDWQTKFLPRLVDRLASFPQLKELVVRAEYGQKETAPANVVRDLLKSWSLDHFEMSTNEERVAEILKAGSLAKVRVTTFRITHVGRQVHSRIAYSYFPIEGELMAEFEHLDDGVASHLARVLETCVKLKHFDRLVLSTRGKLKQADGVLSRGKSERMSLGPIERAIGSRSIVMSDPKR